MINLRKFKGLFLLVVIMSFILGGCGSQNTIFKDSPELKTLSELEDEGFKNMSDLYNFSKIGLDGEINGTKFNIYASLRELMEDENDVKLVFVSTGDDKTVLGAARVIKNNEVYVYSPVGSGIDLSAKLVEGDSEADADYLKDVILFGGNDDASAIFDKSGKCSVKTNDAPLAEGSSEQCEEAAKEFYKDNSVDTMNDAIRKEFFYAVKNSDGDSE